MDPITGGCNRRSTPDHSMDVDVAFLLSLIAKLAAEVGRVRLRMQRREASHDRLQHAHWVALWLKGAQKRHQLGVKLVFLTDFISKRCQLVTSRQFAVDQQEGDFEETGLLGKLVDGVATVFQNSVVAVDKRYARDAAHCVHVGWVKGAEDLAALAFEVGQLCRADRVVRDLELELLPCSVIDDRKRVLRHQFRVLVRVLSE